VDEPHRAASILLELGQLAGEEGAHLLGHDAVNVA
jgi:hypothetical protein